MNYSNHVEHWKYLENLSDKEVFEEYENRYQMTDKKAIVRVEYEFEQREEKRRALAIKQHAFERDKKYALWLKNITQRWYKQGVQYYMDRYWFKGAELTKPVYGLVPIEEHEVMIRAADKKLYELLKEDTK